MVETLMALVMICEALISGDPKFYIAAGVFAIAAQISGVCDRMDKSTEQQEEN